MFSYRKEKNSLRRVYLILFANGTMSADIFKCKMALEIQLKWIFLALKWAASCLKNCVQFFQESNPCKYQTKPDHNEALKFCLNFYN